MGHFEPGKAMRQGFATFAKAICAVVSIIMVFACAQIKSDVLHVEGDVFVVISEGEINPNGITQSEFGIYLQTPEGKYQVHLNDSTQLVDVEHVTQIFQGGRYSVKGESYTPNLEFINVPSRGGEFLGFIRASEVRKLEQ